MNTQELLEKKLKLYIRNFHCSDNLFDNEKHCPLCNGVLSIRLNSIIVAGEDTEIYVDEYKCHSCVLQHSILGSVRRENDPIKEYALIYKSNIFSGDDFCAKHRKDILVAGHTSQRVKEFLVWQNSKPVVGPVIIYLAKDCNGRPTYVGYDASKYKFEDAFIAMTDFNLPCLEVQTSGLSAVRTKACSMKSTPATKASMKSWLIKQVGDKTLDLVEMKLDDLLGIAKGDKAETK